MAQQCVDLENYLLHSPYNLLLHIHLLILFVGLLALVVLIRQFWKHRIVVHGNLLFLFANILFLLLIHTFAWFIFLLRYQILLFIRKEPCDLLTPTWMVPFFHGPYFVHSIAFPSFHFIVMLERLRATVYAEKYEREGGRLFIMMVILTWMFSIAFMLYVIFAAFADTQLMGQPQSLVYLTSKYNAQPIFIVMMFALFLVIFTASCDWRIFLLNRRIRAMRNYAIRYSLSRIYQLNENALAMRLILPLDISYALLYPIYICLVIVVRGYQPTLSPYDYNLYYYLADTLLFLHSAVTIFVYIHFVRYLKRNRRRNVTIKFSNEHVKLHFKQLETQWR